jgi:putative DNA primase/helicase
MLKDEFSLSDLEDKDVNIDTEMSRITIRDSAILKKLTGRQPIRIQRKNQRAYDTNLHAKFFFSANNIPSAEDHSDAYYRRNLVLCFPNQFEGSREDKDYLEKLTIQEELSGIFNVLMSVLRTLMKRNYIFVNEGTITERREKYELITDPVQKFVESSIAEVSVQTDKVLKRTLFEAYKLFCIRRKLPVESIEKFGKILKEKGFHEGRESSGERRTFWKSIRLVVKVEEVTPATV